MPQRFSAGTLYFLVACWGSYIHFEPLTSMTGLDTAAALKAAVLFFRERNVTIDTIRMDNQSSPEVRAVATELKLVWNIINPYQKEPNRAERAIRTGKNHIIAVRSGFHKECPNSCVSLTRRVEAPLTIARQRNAREWNGSVKATQRKV